MKILGGFSSKTPHQKIHFTSICVIYKIGNGCLIVSGCNSISNSLSNIWEGSWEGPNKDYGNFDYIGKRDWEMSF